MHRRAAIRNAIVARLQTIAGVTVTNDIVVPETINSLPAVNVNTGADTLIEDDEAVAHHPTTGAWPQRRDVEFELECRITVVAGGDLGAAADALALSVEQAMHTDATLGGECDYCVLTDSSATDLIGDIEQPAALKTLTYRVEYRVDARDPQALED